METRQEKLEDIAQRETKRILVVEDQAIYSKQLKEALASNKYSIDLAETLEEALNRINQTKYDLVITDGRFPKNKREGTGFYGDNICRATKAKDSGTIVIGYSNDTLSFKEALDQKYEKCETTAQKIADIVGKYLTK